MASMLTVDIPGWRSLQLEVLLLDVNGTLTLDGDLLGGVDAGLKALVQVGMLDVQLVSADTFGRLDNIAAQRSLACGRNGWRLDNPIRRRKRMSSGSWVPSAWSRSATDRTARTCCARYCGRRARGPGRGRAGNGGRGGRVYRRCYGAATEPKTARRHAQALAGDHGKYVRACS